MDSTGRFQLRTLGRLALVDASGREDPSLSTRPRKLALLAWLVMRPERRATRDRIIGVFWGDRDEERARNSLSDAISHLRRVLGRESIWTQASEVGIAGNAPLVIDSVELAAAAARRDHASVIALNRGAFLEGFYVNDAPEFDDWRDRERARLDALFARSADARCAELAASASWDDCRTLAERWLDVEPASDDAAVALLRAIGAPKTHAAAVAVLAAFDDLRLRLERDLGISPDARVTALAMDVAEQLAKTPAPAPMTIVPHAAPLDLPAASAGTGPRRIRRLRWLLGAAGALASLALLGVLVASRSSELDPHRVVVAAFQNRTGDPALAPLGAIAADWVSRGRTETRAVEVADPLLSAGVDSTLDPRVIGRRAQAGTVVLGTYARQGDSLEIEARLVDANDGRVLRVTQPVVAPVSQPILAVNALRQRVAGAMAAEVDPVIAGLAREASQAPTYEAYLAFIEGLDLFSHKDYRASIAPFLRAASLDSSFVSPRIWALAAYGNLGDYPRADSLRLTVMPLRGRLAPLDKGLLDLWTNDLKGDRPAEYAASREMLAAAPGSELSLFIGGVAAMYVNRPNEAVRLLRRIPVERSAVAWDVYGTRLAQALHAARRHGEEIVETERRLARQPTSMRAMEEHARALIAAGRTTEAMELINRILDAARDPSRTPGSSAFDLGDELAVHGHAAEATVVFRRVVAWARALPPEQARARLSRDLLMIASYRSGELAAADSIAMIFLPADTASVNLLRLHGFIAARRGDVAEAERMSAKLETLNGPYLRGSNTLARAEIAALLGRKEDATRLARQASAQGTTPTTLHVIVEFLPLRGYPPFDALVQPIG